MKMSDWKIIDWLLGRRKSSAEKIAMQWKRDALYVMRQLQKELKRLEKVESKFNELCLMIDEERREVTEVIDSAKERAELLQSVLNKYDHAEEGLNNELEILKKVLIPGLTLANEQFRQQVETMITMDVARQVAVGQGEKK